MLPDTSDAQALWDTVVLHERNLKALLKKKSFYDSEVRQARARRHLVR